MAISDSAKITHRLDVRCRCFFFKTHSVNSQIPVPPSIRSLFCLELVYGVEIYNTDVFRKLSRKLYYTSYFYLFFCYTKHVILIFLLVRIELDKRNKHGVDAITIACSV